MCGLVALRLLHRGGRAHRAGLPRHFAGRDGRGRTPTRRRSGSASSSCSTARSARATACTCSTRSGSSRRSSKLPGVKLPTVVPRPAKISSSTAWPTSAPTTTCGSSRPICEYVKETGDLSFFDEIMPVRRPGRGDGVRTPQAVAGLLGRADRRQRHLQGAARGLERLPEPGRRRERHGLISCIHWALLAFVEAARYLG